MATLIKGLLSFNLDWQFVLVGVFLAITMELVRRESHCHLQWVLIFHWQQHLPIFAGGVIKGIVDWRAEKKNKKLKKTAELGKGSLFATGLVAGGALAGVIVALLSVNDYIAATLATVNIEHTLNEALGSGGYQIAGYCLLLPAWFRFIPDCH